MMIKRSIFTILMLCVVAHAQQPAPKKPEPPVIGTIDGKVVNESGQPLAGAGVFVRTINAGVNRSTITDMDGNFRVNGLEPGLYYVTANTPAYTNAPGEPDAPKYYRLGDTARGDMVRGGAIKGTGTTAMREPMIAVRVRASMIRDAKGKAARLGGLQEQPTDDRGIYRIYGLAPGTYIVSAGGASFITSGGQYDTDIPTFAPSSTRDTAAEISVRSGEDVSVDIRYRGEPGHSVSGSVKMLGTSNASIILTRPGSIISIATTIQVPQTRGFVFNGLADGDYFVAATESFPNPAVPAMPTLAISEPRKITVKGADVTGIELI